MINLDYLYNPDATKAISNKNYFVDKKLGFSVIENGMILPHKNVIISGRWHFGHCGIVDSEGNFIKNSSVHYGTGGAYTPPPESVKHSSETAVYFGLFYPVWGHTLTDNIRRVWFLKSDIFKSEFKNCPVVYIPYKEGYHVIDRHPDFKRLLEILEVDVDKLQPITQPTQYDKIILPDDSFTSPHNPGTGFTTEYRETIDRIRDFALKNRTPTSSKKIYFFHGKKQLGEERLAEYLKSKGYDIIKPEQRADFDEELNLLINCESFVAPIGSCSHNSIFLREGTETILIPRAIGNQSDCYQEMLNQVNSLNINYIDASLSILSSYISTGPYLFIISEQLKRFFGDKFDSYEEEDLKNFLEYVKKFIKNPFNPKSDIYYGNILPHFVEQLKQRKDLIKAYGITPNWKKTLLTYQTHLHNKGWGDGWKNENQPSNPLDQKLDVLAIRLNFPSIFHKIYYAVYFNEKEGWSPEVQAPEMAGTVGIRKPIFGMKIRLDEAGAEEFDIFYRMHKFDNTWTPWAKNGEELLSGGIVTNSIQIKLENKLQIRPLITYQTHLHNKGWRDGWKSENQPSNPLDQKLDVLAIRINPPPYFHKIYYSVYFNNSEGWSPEVQAPEMAGTVGIRKPIFGMRIRLDEAGAEEFNILYRMHKFDDTWTPWAKNGEALYSHGVKLNAIQVKLENKSPVRPMITYQTHVTKIGWSAWNDENQISNPLDQKYDIQAIKIDFQNTFHKVYYSVYYNAEEGWSEEVTAPEMTGTIGKHKPIFGMKIWLNESGTNEFDILYRAHKFDDTWTPWAKNGEVLYSDSVKLNAIQIKLEPKT